MTTLFDPIRFGNIAAANRIVMAPMSRNRAGPGQVPTPMMSTYDEQRATAGLIVSEATQISPEGQGYRLETCIDTCRERQISVAGRY